MRSEFEEKERIWVKNLNSEGAMLIDDPFPSGGTPTWFPDNKTFAYSSDRDGMYQIYIRSIDETYSKRITFGNFNSSQPIVSPDGRSIAYLTNLDEANVFATDIATRKETAITSNVNLQLFPSYSPDGTRVAYGTNSDSRKIYSANLKIDDLNAGPSIDVNLTGCCPAWSPDGQEVALFTMEGLASNINKYSIRDNRVSTLTTVGIGGEAISLAPYDYAAKFFDWSPDSTKIVFGSANSGISNVWTIDRNGSNEQMVTDLKEPTFRVHSPMWSPEGDRIAFLHSHSKAGIEPENRISIFDSGETRIVAQFKSSVRMLSWSKKLNGVYVAVGDSEKGARLNKQIIYFIFADGSDRVQTVSRLPETRQYGISISPDEKWVTFSQRTGGIDDLYIASVDGGEPERITSNVDSTLFYSGVGWSPDSRTLLYSKQTGGMQISLISHK
jgi:Tol biopolymer transport system component